MHTVTKRSLEFERSYTQKRIDECNTKIEKLKETIAKYLEKLEEIDILEKELEEYERRPISERTMTKYIYKDSGTIHIMDSFEAVNEKGFRKFDRMIIENSFSYDENFAFCLILERKGNRTTVGSITMTDFKQGYTRALTSHAKEEIRKQIEETQTQIKDGDIILFEVPFLLRAQNSSNRTGYGNIYNGEDLVHEGTLYGETTNYAFVGAKMIDIKEREAKRKRRMEQIRAEISQRRREDEYKYIEIDVPNEEILEYEYIIKRT